MTLVDLIAGLAIAVGLVGILVPVLPGTLLVGAAVLGWAIWSDGAAVWWVFAVVAAVLLAGAVAKYAVPGRRLKESGVPTASLALGAVLGLAGFFAVPIVGLPAGFVLGIYLGEVRRVGGDHARETTLAALRAIGLSVLIELTAGLVAALVWAIGVLVA